jgi:uncharacterized membrane protein YqjE
MVTENPRGGVTRAIADLWADLSDLLHKEIRLASAEITENIASRLQSTIWMAVAGLIGFVAVLVVVEAAVFAVASFGIALYWACLMVAAVLIAAAAAAFFHGHSLAERDLTPTRSVRQIAKDIQTIKEQLT